VSPCQGIVGGGSRPPAGARDATEDECRGFASHPSAAAAGAAASLPEVVTAAAAAASAAGKASGARRGAGAYTRPPFSSTRAFFAKYKCRFQ